MRVTRLFCLVTALIVGAQGAEAESQTQKLGDTSLAAVQRILAKDVASECTNDGTSRDDGSFEDAIRAPFVSDARFVQLLQPSSFPALLDRVCVCWVTSEGLESMSYNILAYDDNGNGGQPGTFLGGKTVSAVNLTAFDQEFFGYECSDLNIQAPSGGVYVGVGWNSAAEVHYFLCEDESASTPQAAMYTSSSAGTIWSPVTNNNPDIHALGIRAHFTQVVPPADPPPPSVPALTSLQAPGFRFWVRISDSRIGTQTATCVPETICVAGAIPTRAEILLRLTPRPGGKLWPTVIKFNTTKTEVWVQQIRTGLTRYYSLPALDPAGSTLPGLIDKVGFQQ